MKGFFNRLRYVVVVMFVINTVLYFFDGFGYGLGWLSATSCLIYIIILENKIDALRVKTE